MIGEGEGSGKGLDEQWAGYVLTPPFGDANIIQIKNSIDADSE
jgi:hypothetical protein